MQITEADIEKTNDEKPKKKWKKIILTILAVWIGLAIISGIAQTCVEDENTGNSSTTSKTFNGFENITFGTNKNTALQIMKDNGWVQISENRTTVGNYGNIMAHQILFKKDGIANFSGHDFSFVTLFFEENTGAFYSFTISFKFDKKDEKKYKKFVKDCTSISDFKFCGNGIAEDGEASVYQNSRGDACMVSWGQASNVYYLSFQYLWTNAPGL